MKTIVFFQLFLILIECFELGCDKKYKYINGLRYYQAYVYLEEVSIFIDKLILCLYKLDNFLIMVVYVWQCYQEYMFQIYKLIGFYIVLGF